MSADPARRTPAITTTLTRCTRPLPPFTCSHLASPRGTCTQPNPPVRASGRPSPVPSSLTLLRCWRLSQRPRTPCRSRGLSPSPYSELGLPLYPLSGSDTQTPPVQPATPGGGGPRIPALSARSCARFQRFPGGQPDGAVPCSPRGGPLPATGCASLAAAVVSFQPPGSTLPGRLLLLACGFLQGVHQEATPPGPAPLRACRWLLYLSSEAAARSRFERRCTPGAPAGANPAHPAGSPGPAAAWRPGRAIPVPGSQLGRDSPAVAITFPGSTWEDPW